MRAHGVSSFPEPLDECPPGSRPDLSGLAAPFRTGSVTGRYHSVIPAEPPWRP